MRNDGLTAQNPRQPHDLCLVAGGVGQEVHVPGDEGERFGCMDVVPAHPEGERLAADQDQIRTGGSEQALHDLGRSLGLPHRSSSNASIASRENVTFMRLAFAGAIA